MLAFEAVIAMSGVLWFGLKRVDMAASIKICIYMSTPGRKRLTVVSTVLCASSMNEPLFSILKWPLSGLRATTSL